MFEDNFNLFQMLSQSTAFIDKEELKKNEQ